MIDYLRKRPMLVAAVGCTISAVCGFYSLKALAVVLFLFIGGFLFALFKKNAVFSVVTALIIIMCISCFGELKSAKNLNKLTDSEVVAEICYEATTYKSEKVYKSNFEVLNSNILPRGTKLSLWHSSFNFTSGNVLKAKINIRSIDDGYKASNYSNGVYIDGNIESFENADYSDKVMTAFGHLRGYIAELLFKNMSYESAATMSALVFGDRDYFSDGFYDNVKAAGVSHVMVVSGMHLTIIVLLLLKLTEKFLYNSYLRAFIMFCTVILLCGVCGFTNSILRAGVTYIIMSLALLLNRDYTGENALGTAVTLILISSPFTIFNVAFQLSVLSTFGILAVAIPICESVEFKYKIIRDIFSTVILSLSATLLTLPVTVYIFGYVSNVAVITNLLISFPVTMVLSATVLAVISSPVLPFVSSVILRLVDYGVRYINFVINYLGTRKYAVTRTPEWFVYIAILLNLLVFAILLTCKKIRDMLKLKEINQKIIKERGSKKKWQSFLKKI